MLDIREALLLEDPDAIVDEIYLRKKLHREMVGTLYPNIVVDEVGRLVKRFDEVGGARLSDALWKLEQSKPSPQETPGRCPTCGSIYAFCPCTKKATSEGR
jgi:hypothetical protein